MTLTGKLAMKFLPSGNFYHSLIFGIEIGHIIVEGTKLELSKELRYKASPIHVMYQSPLSSKHRACAHTFPNFHYYGRIHNILVGKLHRTYRYNYLF